MRGSGAAGAAHRVLLLRLSVLSVLAAAGAAAAGVVGAGVRAAGGARRSPATRPAADPALTPRGPAARGPAAGASPRAETPGKFGRLSVRWNDPAPAGAPAAATRPDRHAALFQRLEEAFRARPVWSTLALRNTLGVSREALRETLPFIGYKFRDGPWKGLWTRFGYDPRASPEARDLQVRAGSTASAPRVRAARSVTRALALTRPPLRCARAGLSHHD
jgi:hypothetical protein